MEHPAVTEVEAEPDYASMKVAELKAVAKERGIKGYSKLKKAGFNIFDRVPPNYETKAHFANEKAQRHRRKVVKKYFKECRRKETRWRQCRQSRALAGGAGRPRSS